MSLPLTYKEGNCFINAYINKTHYYKDKKLRMVYGSLGMNDWFEYGGKNWTLKDFKKKQEGWRWDAHGWLEDSDGNVYDYAFEWYNEVAEINTKRGINIEGLIEGKSKDELKSLGLTYVEATKDISLAIFLSQKDTLIKVVDDLKNGRAKWAGDYLQYEFFPRK